MKRLVIANRGEIARRILRAGRDYGWKVAVISTPEDSDAPVRFEADAVFARSGDPILPVRPTVSPLSKVRY